MLNGPVTYKRHLIPLPAPAPAPSAPWPRLAGCAAVLIAVSALISGPPPIPSVAIRDSASTAAAPPQQALRNTGGPTQLAESWFPLIEVEERTGSVWPAPQAQATRAALEDRQRARLRLVAQSLVRQTRTVRVAAGIAPSLRAAIEQEPARSVALHVPVPMPQPEAVRAPDWRSFGSAAMPVPKGDPADPRVALVIDDLGINAARTRAVMALPAPLTMAFLPYGRHSRRLARVAADSGHEIMLHLPMEPHGPEDPGPQALLDALPAQEFTNRVAWAFGQIDGFVGFNNHMGSRLTENAQAMSRLMGMVKDRDLYFLDSLTSARSVAYEAALKAGLPTLVRQIFLDHDASPAAIRARLEETLERARLRGAAIAIGHPYATTLAALREWIPFAKDQGLTFVPVSAFLNPDTRERLLLAARLPAGAP